MQLGESQYYVEQETDVNGDLTVENGNMQLYLRVDRYQERVLIEYWEALVVLASIGGLVGAIYKPVRILLEYLSMIQFEAKIIK